MNDPKFNIASLYFYHFDTEVTFTGKGSPPQQILSILADLGDLSPIYPKISKTAALCIDK